MFTRCYPAQWSRRTEVASLLTAAVVALAILLPITARAQTETVLYSFTYATSTGGGCPGAFYANSDPQTGLLLYKGHLYGTTPKGGTGIKGEPGTDDGMVFRLTPPKSGTTWAKQTLHSFPEITEPPIFDGTYPCSRLIEKNGVLYGSTISGGTHNWGTVFSLTPPGTGQTLWTETILYNFTGGTDGGQPYDGLSMDSNGSLYGVNNFGGGNGGAVFELIPGASGYSEVTLLSNNNGVLYNGGLLLDKSTGALYGTTQNGGTGYGNVFQLTNEGGKWVYDDLYDFTGGSDGAYPNRGLVGFAGDLFGTTQGGGSGVAGSGDGVLFELRELIAGNPYSLFVQHTFMGQASNDGAIPHAGLHQDAAGTIWSTTVLGGSDNLGTIFELYPDRYKVHDWHYLLVYSFTGGTTDGANPESPLIEDSSGNLYGTTNTGGSANKGTVFEWKP
jgi:uncharacterized repeat protein (TIGR03803 family)